MDAENSGTENRENCGVNPPSDENDRVFCHRLKVLRRVLGISAAELDRRAGFADGTAARLERCQQRIYATHLYRIGEVSGVGIEYFYYGIGNGAGDGNNGDCVSLLVDTVSQIRSDVPAGGAREAIKMLLREMAGEDEPPIE